MRRKLLGVLFIAAALVVPSGLWAACSTITLTNTNTTVTGITVDLSVCDNGTTTTVTVASINGDLGSLGGVARIDQFGWSGSSAFGGVLAGNSVSWFEGSGQGFDHFTTITSGAYAQPQGQETGDVGLSWQINGTGVQDFAVHLAFNNGCTGFWSDGTTTSPNSSPCTQVPEPATMTLLGTGLLGIAGVVRRRLKR